MDFSSVNRMKSAGARSGKYGGWEMTFTSRFVIKSWFRREECTAALSWWSNHFFPLHKSGLFLLSACSGLFITFR